MRIRAHHCLILALAMLIQHGSKARAEDGRAENAARGKPTPIIFSAPKSDTVSSNLNQLGGRTSPLTDLESSLKRPFQIFESERPGNRAAPLTRFVPPASAPVLKNRRTKDLLEKRAEDRYLFREDDELDSPKGDLPGLDDGPLAVSGKRTKTPLDRYYDNIDRLRLGQTNRPVRSLDLFAEKSAPTAQQDPKLRNPGGWFDREFSASTQPEEKPGLSVFSDSRFEPDRPKPQSFGSFYRSDPVVPDRKTTRAMDTRLEEFKRLIDGAGYGTRNDFNALPPTPSAGSVDSSPSPGIAVPQPLFSNSPQPVGGGRVSTPGFSGAIGVPVGVPDLSASSPSLTPTPPLQQTVPKPPVPKFSVPRGRF